MNADSRLPCLRPCTFLNEKEHSSEQRQEIFCSFSKKKKNNNNKVLADDLAVLITASKPTADHSSEWQGGSSSESVLPLGGRRRGESNRKSASMQSQEANGRNARYGSSFKCFPPKKTPKNKKQSSYEAVADANQDAQTYF